MLALSPLSSAEIHAIAKLLDGYRLTDADLAAIDNLDAGKTRSVKRSRFAHRIHQALLSPTGSIARQTACRLDRRAGQRWTVNPSDVTCPNCLKGDNAR